jgi:hypothetical protein
MSLLYYLILSASALPEISLNVSVLLVLISSRFITKATPTEVSGWIDSLNFMTLNLCKCRAFICVLCLLLRWVSCRHTVV